MQARVDSLIAVYEDAQIKSIRPFNPNYISDFKGYTLGMSPQEIDRLHAFRSSGRFLKTVEEFKLITGVSDSLLNTFSRFFVFPDRKIFQGFAKNETRANDNVSDNKTIDLNKATASELMRIRGIGEVLSQRIVKFRDALGGFLVGEQLYDVYGLEEQVAKEILTEFKIVDKPVVSLINVNEASAQEIAGLVYISWPLARRIVSYRSSYGFFESWDELTKIEDFPIHQIDRIKLYLTL